MRAREAALRVLLAVEAGEMLQVALPRTLEAAKLEARDAALTTELVYGTLRRLRELDGRLQVATRRSMAAQRPPVRWLLRLGAYQLLFSRIPSHAAVNETVALCGRWVPAARGFVNAALRAVRPGPSVSGLPAWLRQRWVDRYGRQGAEAMEDWAVSPAPLTLRVNRLKTSRSELVARLMADGHAVRPTTWSADGVRLHRAGRVQSLAGYAEGLFAVQDEAAMLVGEAAGPVSGLRVVEVGTGRGGKLGHLFERMGGRGEAVGVDTSEPRIRSAQAAMARLGHQEIRLVVRDAREPWPQLQGWADCVVVDAPCTGLGVVARRPDILQRIDPRAPSRHAVLQRELLDAAGRMVRPGGLIVYAVCSLEPEEGETVVSAFLSGASGFRPESIRGGTVAWEHFEGAPGRYTSLPYRDGTDGFFIARLRRTGER